MAAHDVITLDDAKDHLNMSGTVEDFELAVHVTAASEMVDYFVGPVIVREFVDYEVTGFRGLVLDRRPVVSVVSAVSVSGGADLVVADLRVNPTAGVVRPAGGGRLPCGPFDVTYTAGRAATVAEVPDALALACRVIVANLWETQRASTLGPQPGGFGDAFPPPAGGSGFAIPYRARDLMGPYRTVAVA